MLAALRASEMGSSVVLLDKATIRRGGSVDRNGPYCNGSSPRINDFGRSQIEC